MADGQRKHGGQDLRHKDVEHLKDCAIDFLTLHMGRLGDLLSNKMLKHANHQPKVARNNKGKTSKA